MGVMILIEDGSPLLMLLKDCYRFAFRCCVVVCMSPLPLLLSDRVPVQCSGCTWREGRVDNALDSGRVDIIVEDKGLMAVRVLRNCHVVVCVCHDCHCHCQIAL